VLGRAVVLKEISAAGSTPSDVLREARAAAALSHPHVVTVHDVVDAGDRVLIVMEHLEGGSLAARLAHGPLAHDAFVRVGSELLAALGAVHGAGLVHRDVKPANILLAADGRAKLADFGVSRAELADATATAAGGAPSGTLRYMAPEQAKGLAATPRSDLYAAALTLHEAWTGRAYFAPRPGESALELRLRVASPPAPAAPAGAPPALAAWFERALAPAPEDRFPDAPTAREAFGRVTSQLRTQRTATGSA